MKKARPRHPLDVAMVSGAVFLVLLLIVLSPLAQSRKAATPRPTTLLLLRMSDPPECFSAGDPANHGLFQEDLDHDFHIRFFSRPVGHGGRYAPTSRRWNFSPQFHDLGNRPPPNLKDPAVHAAIHAALVRDHQLNGIKSPLPAHFAKGVTTMEQTLYLGYAINTLLFGTLLISGYMTQKYTRRAWRMGRRHRRLDAGLCPTCQYNITGVETCPECGTCIDQYRSTCNPHFDS